MCLVKYYWGRWGIVWGRGGGLESFVGIRVWKGVLKDETVVVGWVTSSKVVEWRVSFKSAEELR